MYLFSGAMQAFKISFSILVTAMLKDCLGFGLGVFLLFLFFVLT